MSDYIPNPDTEMHINQMPEECLRLLFTQLPIQSQFEAGNVCHLWRTVRNALFRTQKSLALKIGQHDFDKHYLIVAFLDKPSITYLVALFPSLTQLAILANNPNLFNIPQVGHLLLHYRDRLVTLKIQSTNFRHSHETHIGTDLFAAINALTKLKRLTLYFSLSQFCRLLPFDLPILRQLESLDFSSLMRKSILTLWAPHLEARSTTMAINLNIGRDFQEILEADRSADLFESFSPKVASMFTYIPKLNCDLQQFQRLSTRYINLTKLWLRYRGDTSSFTLDVPSLMKALTNLKQLAMVHIHDSVLLGDHQFSQDGLPQLPSVKEWYLTLESDPKARYSHALLTAWTANLGWIFPNLQNLIITFKAFTGCTDCDLKSLEKIPAKKCLHGQLEHIKKQQQQGLKLSKAEIAYMDIEVAGSPYPRRVKCTLEDHVD